MTPPGPPLPPGVRVVPVPASEAADGARRHGAHTHLVGPVDSKAALIAALGAAFGFPDWVGPSWDALYDALQDLSWQPPGPHAVVWAGADRLRDADPGAYELALRVLADAADAASANGRPLTFLLVHADD